MRGKKNIKFPVLFTMDYKRGDHARILGTRSFLNKANLVHNLFLVRGVSGK
jgi:hypothetical protein